MKIGYALLDRQYQEEKDHIESITRNIISSGQYILGKYVEDLETEIARYCGTKYCVSVNSGTDALVLSMYALGIRKGDEVITPPNSFISSTSSILHLGGKPIFVDVSDDMNIDPYLIEKYITPKTKAIMPVHLTGRVCAMSPILEIAKKHGLLVIEDAAQSFGSMYKDKKSGSFGDVGCFSAHPLKVFNACGDGGFVTTDSEDVCNNIRLLRNHGIVKRGYVKKWGYVSRLDTIQAAILLYRLKKVDGYITRRRKNAKLLQELLDKNFINIILDKDEEYNSYQTFVIQVDNRDNLRNFLKDKGVETSIHYPTPIHLQEAARSLGYKEGSFPKTELQASRILSIPVSQYLTDKEVRYIAEKINQFYRG